MNTVEEIFDGDRIEYQIVILELLLTLYKGNVIPRETVLDLIKNLRHQHDDLIKHIEEQE